MKILLKASVTLTTILSLLGCNSEDESITLHIQSEFPILQITDAPQGGAHPVGGPANVFVQMANPITQTQGVSLVLHSPGKPHPADIATIKPAITDFKQNNGNLYKAVAAGAIDAGISIPIQNGHPFGSLYIAGPPFGLEPDEFIAWLYQGGGLTLQQSLYDQYFDNNLIVIPVGITPTQAAGYFPEPIPDPKALDITPDEAMKQLCSKPWIVRWPTPASGIWNKACEAQGIKTAFIGKHTRCEIPQKSCPSADNPERQQITTLTFGGFVPGAAPQAMARHGNIDVYELNLPSTDIQMIKLATGQSDKTNAEADLTSVISKAPYLYAGAWHQQLTYIELIINRSVWNSLSQTQRQIIQTTAKAATLENYAIALKDQNAAMELLVQNGVIVMQWPESILDLLRAQTNKYLDAYAAELETKGDTAYGKVLNHMRDFQKAHAVFADFGDVDQGKANLPSYSK